MGALIKAADRSRLSIDLLALGSRVDGGFKAEVEAEGGSVYVANALGRKDIGAILRTRRRVREGKYDVIHTHTAWASLWGTFVGKLLKVPVVATLYDARADQAPTIDSQKEEERAVRSLRRWGSRVVALSGAQWDRYIQDGTFSRSFLEVIYQGVEASETAIPAEEKKACQIWLRRTAGFPQGGQIAVTIADLHEWESGVDVLVSAIPMIAKAHPQVRFLVVGEGEHKGELERRVRARGLNKLVSWHGLDDNIQRILSGGDFLIHPGLRDPFPVPVLKAMAAGLPVIGTRGGGVPEIIGTSEAGRLVPRSDVDALAQAAIELLEDPSSLTAMGRAAADRAFSLFPVSGWANRVERLYREVVEDAQHGRASRPRSYARLDVKLLGLNGRGSANGARGRRIRPAVVEVG